jgi:hypothetical protein
MRLWCFGVFYSSLLLMLFCHDPLYTIGMNAFVEMFKEFAIACSIKFNFNIFNLSTNWQPANLWLNIFFASIAAVIGSWIIRTLGSPALIVYPFEDMERIGLQYNVYEIQILRHDNFKTSNFSRLEVNSIRWKYLLQLVCISWISTFIFYFQDNEYLPPSEYSTECFRVDWFIYFLLQIIILIILYLTNYSTKFEKKVLWKNNKIRYNLFYATIGISLCCCLLPSICMFKQPKLMLIYSIVSLMGIVLIISLLCKFWLNKNLEFSVTLMQRKNYFFDSLNHNNGNTTFNAEDYDAEEFNRLSSIHTSRVTISHKMS